MSTQNMPSLGNDINTGLPLPSPVGGEPRILDTDLATRLGFSQPRDIRKLIKRWEADLARMGVCATVAQTSGAQGGRPTEAFYLNRKQAIFITAKSDTADATDITIEIIERFDAYERNAAIEAAMAAFNVPRTLHDALRLAADQSETIERQKAEIAEMAPKADALDRIAMADGSLCITDAAKALQVRPKELFEFLRSHHWIYRRIGGDHDIGYQTRVNAGDLEHKVTTVLKADGHEKVTEQVRVTPKGLTKLAALVKPILRDVSAGEAA